ncbi:MAG: response regulator [Spirochaetaceae bacterium]|nr:MAG: response regulator [Spirochaetaceae bacterium]
MTTHPGYAEEQKDRAVRNARIAAIFAAVAIMLFSFLDQIVYPDYFRTFLLIRLIVVLLSAATLGLTYLPGARSFGHGLGMFQYVITAFSVVVMVHLSEGYLSPYYAGVSFVLIAFLAILPMDHIRAAVVCSIIYASYIVPIAIRGGITEWAVFYNNNAFLLGTVLLAIISSYMSTRLRIREYAARWELAQANEDLKHLDVLKSQFFANVSHEVRTPLTSIIAPVQSLYEGELGELTEEQRILLAQVYRNALRLLDMINQMLDFARFDAKKMQVKLSEVDLAAVIDDTVSAFREVAVNKSLELDYVLDDPPGPIYLDREKMDRILTNLVRNAIKFTEQGRIIVRLGRYNGGVAISVEDTGIGIPKNQVSTIFERFRQVDSTSTRRYEGTGLGLTIVKESVEIQKGTVEVTSKPGQGTTFTVRLPMNLDMRMPEAMSKRRESDRRRGERRAINPRYEGPERRSGSRRRHDLASVDLEDLVFIDSSQPRDVPMPTDEQQSGTLPGFRVLYVEDNADLRSYVRKMLHRKGHTVTTAVDGLEGWTKVESFEPEVIVSDIMMPRLDGYDLMQKIHEDTRFQGIPIVLTTAKSEIDERIRGLRRGADDYLAKPINISELDARIRNLVTRRLFHEAVARAASLEHRMHDLTMSFSRSLDLRDHYTADHSTDVLTYGTIIAEEMGLSVNESFRDALLLHDLGKIGVPDRILLKEGPLDGEEWTVMKKHAEYGAHLLAQFDSFREVSEIVLAHQERFDGSGYPRGLEGTDIPLTARIIAVADAWHAMIEDRPYRKALETSAAMAELSAGSGTQFDPAVVDAFLRGIAKHAKPGGTSGGKV